MRSLVSNLPHLRALGVASMLLMLCSCNSHERVREVNYPTWLVVREVRGADPQSELSQLERLYIGNPSLSRTSRDNRIQWEVKYGTAAVMTMVCEIEPVDKGTKTRITTVVREGDLEAAPGLSIWRSSRSSSAILDRAIQRRLDRIERLVSRLGPAPASQQNAANWLAGIDFITVLPPREGNSGR